MTSTESRLHAEWALAMARVAEDDAERSAWIDLAAEWLRLARDLGGGAKPRERTNTGDSEDWRWRECA